MDCDGHCFGPVTIDKTFRWSQNNGLWTNTFTWRNGPFVTAGLTRSVRARGRGRYTPHRSLNFPHADKKVKTRKPFAVSIRTARRNCKGICEVPGLNPGTETAYSNFFAKLPSEPPDKSDNSNAYHDTNISFPTRLRICVKSVYKLRHGWLRLPPRSRWELRSSELLHSE